MTFFDALDRFVSDLKSSLKPEQVLKLKSCKSCTFYKNGYCTQAAPPFPILSEYYAQGCIYFSPEQSVTGVQSQTSGQGDQAPASKTVGTVDNTVLQQLINGVTVSLLSAIRDVVWIPLSLIQNGSAEQNFTGWYSQGNVSIDSSVYHNFGKSFKFLDATALIWQKFPFALDPSWWSSLYFWMYAASTSWGLAITYFYTDGTFSVDYHYASAANTWQVMTCAPTSGKKIESIEISTSGVLPVAPVWLDDLTVVF